MNKIQHREKLPTSVRFSLFISSYFPLFVIIVLRQIDQNIGYLSFGGINIKAISLFFSKFGISIILGLISFIGFIGLYYFIKDMKNLTANNGDEFVIHDIQNKNTESIGYIATYLLPFVFQTYSSFFEIFEVILLLIIMYVIYTHSNLIVVNPILNIRYSLYEVKYSNIKSPEITRNAIFIVNDHYLEKGDSIMAKKIKANLFYGIIQEEKNDQY